MNFKPIYLCRNCKQRFEDSKIYSEPCSVQGIESKMELCRDHIEIPDTSLVYRPSALKAPMIRIHKCPENFVGIADLIGIEYYED